MGHRRRRRLRRPSLLMRAVSPFMFHAYLAAAAATSSFILALKSDPSHCTFIGGGSSLSYPIYTMLLLHLHTAPLHIPQQTI